MIFENETLLRAELKIISRSPKENFPSLLDELVKEHKFLYPACHSIIIEEFITGFNLASILL